MMTKAAAEDAQSSLASHPHLPLSLHVAILPINLQQHGDGRFAEQTTGKESS